MVTFIPPYMGEEIKSNAEKKMYDVLQNLDVEEAYVLHFLGLPKHQSKIYCEIDFVVVWKRGVTCMEIKGGPGRMPGEQGVLHGLLRRRTLTKVEPFARITGNMINLLTEYNPLKEICDYEQIAISMCNDNLQQQTELWHLNSHKKVAACLYIPTRNDYIVAQNIGISKVTGSLCAERAAVATAVSKYPDLSMEELTDLFIIGTQNPLLPCGVWCEWLHKINPCMNLYTIKGDDLIEINLKGYYGNESILERIDA